MLQPRSQVFSPLPPYRLSSLCMLVLSLITVFRVRSLWIPLQEVRPLYQYA